MTVALFAGTFDPITVAHCDLIARAARLFEHVWVGVAANVAKTPHSAFERRCAWAQRAVASLDNVSVCGFDTLLTALAQQKKASVLVRGLRNASDFDYESQLLGMNHHLAPELETLFLAATPEYAFISSSLVREVASLGGDISALVPACVLEDIDSWRS